MYLIRVAFDNLKYNIKRTVAITVIIGVAVAAIILYQGYVEYSREGMSLGYIQSTGDFQIALNDYWNNNTSELQLLNSDTLEKVISELKNDKRISYFDCVYDFSGIVGNEKASEIFWGKGFDYPEKHYSATNGVNIFGDDEGCILLGESLAAKIGLTEINGKENVSLLTNSPETGMNLCSMEVKGLTSSGVAQNDAGLLISSRNSILNLMETKNCASYIQVYLNDRNSSKIIEDLNKSFNSKSLNLGIKTWQELNPAFEQVNKLNEFQFYIIRLILCILIFIALLQSVSTSLYERLGEFGTLEAIGLKKYKILELILLEIFYLVVGGLILGLLLSIGVNAFVRIFDIKMTPPGYTEGYSLMFYFTRNNIIKSCCFIIICCFVSILFPVISISKNSVNSLITKQG